METSTDAKGDVASIQGEAFRRGTRCRRIEPGDLGALAALLAGGFPARSAAAWAASLAKLHAWTEGARLPGLGFVLVDGDALVGCLLTIYGPGGRRCNMSSWYVAEGYRRFGSLLVTLATRDRSVTYVNVSSERHTRPIVEANGFRRYTDGVVLAAPLLSRPRRGAIVAHVPPAAAERGDIDVLAHHAGFGCVTFWVLAEGRAYPFVAARRPMMGGLPVAQIVYCARDAAWPALAHAVGRALAARGLFLLLIDAAGPIAGLAGRYLPGRMPKYVRGPDTPAHGDLAYTEIAVIGT